MISLGKPSSQTIEEFLSTKHAQSFSYSEVGMTQHAISAPAGYTVDHSRIQLGQGTLVFDKAVRALRNWQHFKLGWLDVSSSEIPIENGSLVGLLCSYATFWLLFACRIVYVIKEEGSNKKYGFAYGTLPGHPECGEERFTLEWNVSDNSVYYDVLAFSRAGNVFIKVAYPLARSLQKRFTKDSQLAMLTAVNLLPV